MKIEINEANRFTMYFQWPDAALLFWLDWLNSRGVGARLAVTDMGWAVFRNGLTEIKD